MSPSNGWHLQCFIGEEENYLDGQHALCEPKKGAPSARVP